MFRFQFAKVHPPNFLYNPYSPNVFTARDFYYTVYLLPLDALLTHVATLNFLYNELFRYQVILVHVHTV